MVLLTEMKSNTLEPEQFKRIATRNTLAPLGLAVLLSGIFIVLILKLVAVNEWLSHSDRVIAGAHEILQLVVDAETGQRGFVITRKDSFLEPYNESKRVLTGKLGELKTLVSDNPLQVERLNQVEALGVRWEQYAQELLTNDQDQARSLVGSEKGKLITDEIRTKLKDFVRTEETLRDDRNSASQQMVRLALVLIVIGSGVVGIFLALYSRRQLSTVSNIYGDALQKEAEQTKILQDQDWLRSAQATVAERIRGDLDLNEVCLKSLNFLCEYLDAKVGTISSVSGGDLKLCGTYAIAPDEEAKIRKIRIGESLAGQAVKENRFLTLDPAPKDYLKINSTLGAAPSSSVLVAPLTADGVVKGVIELGFARALIARDTELLKLLSEVVGIAMTSAEYRVRLQELLEESQKQAEELQAQQEELRVNNEELEEQSNALKESQAQLENQQSELEQTNNQLGQQAETLEKKNEELNQTRVALEIKAQDLQRASEYKSQFLANMSHELRTPLNSTLILSQLLIDNKSGRLSEEDVEYAQTILSSSNDLLTLINDILDLSKVEAGKVDLQAEPVDIELLLKSFEKSFAPMAHNKGIQFSTEIKTGTPEIFETDRQRLEQILRNLLSNAIKFTAEGSVDLTVSTRPQGKIAFTVKDTGVGIPKDKQKIIFEAFQQADGTTNRQFGGTGLGLTISRDLAKLLRGEISVESAPDKGSAFTLVISPLNQEGYESPAKTSADVRAETTETLTTKATSKPTTRSTVKRSGITDDRDNLDSSLKLLMVVEDDETFARVMYNLSHEVHFQCILAESAEEAVHMAEEYLPHAIILDMQLPDHSGLFVLDRLKENPVTRHIPVHVISSQDFSSTAMQMGAIGYLVKPAEKEKLIAVIKKLEEKLTQNIKKVLIVEDNQVQRESMKKLIGDPSVEVHAVRTGAEAIDLLQSTSFDCLVLDLSLPDMSGFEILERMSQSEALSHPPVIVYTGKDLSREDEEKLQRYSRSIILKGAKSPERLLSEVGLFLHQVESKMPPERQKVLKELRDRDKDLEGRNILLVDDDVRNIFALKNALEQRGAKIEIARNGKEAVSKVQSSDNIELVLMDIMMPEMNGYEAMRAIRSDQKFKSLPIIAVTAKAMADDQEKCLEAGANDYLAKPIDLPKLLSLIRVWLHPTRRR